MVSSFDTVTAALGDRVQAIQTLTRSALSTASAASTRDVQLRATIDALQGFLRQGPETAQRLGSFSVNATPVMYNLRVAAPALVPAVGHLKKLSGGLDTQGTDAYPGAGSSGNPGPQPAAVPPLSADPPYLAKAKPKR